MSLLGINVDQPSIGCQRMGNGCQRVPPVDDKVGISSLPCLAGVLDTIQPSRGIVDTTITLQGSNFPSNTGCPEILIGSHECEVITTAGSQIKCATKDGADTDNPSATNR